MKIKLLFVLACLAQFCHAQIEGTWNGEVDIQTMKLPVIFKISKKSQGYTTTLISPKQSAKEIPTDKTDFSNNELSLEIGSINAGYKGIYKTDHFEGNLIQNGKTMTLNLYRDIKPESSEVSYLNGKVINTQKIDEFLDYMVKNNQEIGSIAIFRDGKPVYKRNFGQNLLPGNTAYDQNTGYQIGSISKLMTAVMLLQLIEQGKLNLTDPLSKFYPEIPNAEKITIQTMLNHTSGLGDYVGESIENNWLFGKAVGDKAIIEAIKKNEVSAKPGEKFKYSNSAYFLLSRILEKIYKKPYNEILKENILNKAPMPHTFSVLDNPKNIFKSYELKNGSWKEVKDFDFHNCIGLGDITSTPEDLNIFINALFNGTFIKKETLDMMISNKKEKVFGSGIMKIPFYNIISYGHGGTTAGSHSIVSFEPTDQLSYAVTINGKNFPQNSFYIGIMNLVYGRDYQYPVFDNTKTPAADLEKYVGDYTSKDIALGLKILIKDDTLYAQGTNQPEFPLTALEKDQFTFEKAGLKLSFTPENKQLHLTQGGKTYLFNKKSPGK
ncbi:serine hydrolase [Chryseobacterium sp. BIGb0232]|uniref:serine hydrolase domain-containing protein n=1 Tax=Chryseobacterium sp. BIGb0232 TaxID=2940598 RepID=UPI000F4938E7|nr:serine hydrolase domain-containing protein [Chryseobacterium sp. BIGb0232]MCS4302319.1 CubicO group peptidase (beta-lactamase class C family) [Chryseobacterium sp. BIGb0232]ROS18264.1 CubicO group peptidase (beta-lactamase class C family) [Chryseobacterium nakagawai]